MMLYHKNRTFNSVLFMLQLYNQDKNFMGVDLERKYGSNGNMNLKKGHVT